MSEQKQDALYRDVMNLHGNARHYDDVPSKRAYMDGHRDARHAAAELVAAASYLFAKDAERLREALQQIADIKPADVNQYARGWVDHCREVARAALEGQPK